MGLFEKLSKKCTINVIKQVPRKNRVSNYITVRASHTHISITVSPKARELTGLDHNSRIDVLYSPDASTVLLKKNDVDGIAMYTSSSATNPLHTSSFIRVIRRGAAYNDLFKSYKKTDGKVVVVSVDETAEFDIKNNRMICELKQG